MGLDRILWDDDYPHSGASGPYSRESMRLASSEIPNAEVRMMLGEIPADSQCLAFQRARIERASAVRQRV